jgi:hypothetical protein
MHGPLNVKQEKESNIVVRRDEVHVRYESVLTVKMPQVFTIHI